MKKIIFYKLNGQICKTVPLTEENLGGTHGMMTRCYLTNNEVVEGLSDAFRVFDEDKRSDKVQDYIYLCTWDNLDEKTGQLIGNDEDKYNLTRRKVIISDIVMVEAILYSNPRWGVGLANKFEFYIKNSGKDKELDIPKLLQMEDINTEKNSENRQEEKLYYYLLVRYEDCLSYKEYNYISDDTTVDIFDRVLVDRAGKLAIAEVIETGYFTKEDCPFPVEKTKHIIKKVDDDYIIENKQEYEFDYEDDEEDEIYSKDGIYLNIEGTKFYFEIQNYVLNGDNDKDWTTVKLKVYNSHFNYYLSNELMTSGEVDILLKSLLILLNNKLKQTKKIEFYEPDLEFILYPNCNDEKQDIHMELNINLTNKSGEYINQKYSIGFDRENISCFTSYIKSVIEMNSYKPI